jgi:hypothetical protein
MTRLVLAVMLAGCWRSSPPQEPPAPRSSPRPDATVQARDPEVLDAPIASIVTPTACPSGPGFSTTISKASQQGNATVVVIDVGTNQGLTQQWTIGPTACTIIRIEQARILAACVGATPAQVTATPTVLCPPGALTGPQHPACPKGIGKDGRLVGVSVQGAATIVTIGIGTAHGVAASWQVRRPPCTITSVGQRTTVATCATTTPDQLRALPTPQVLLCAP